MLIGISGTNLVRIPFSGPAGNPPPGRRSGPVRPLRELAFPLTSEPVKTVRIDFNSIYAGSGIDAVELAGPSGSAWASGAHASSEAPRGGGTYSPYGSAPSVPGSEPLAMIRSETSVSEWSDAWLSYSSFDAIVLNERDISAAPPAVLTALWRYAECGGNLVLLGGGAPPQPWHVSTRTTLEGGQCFDMGFGECYVFKNDTPSAASAADMKIVMDSVNSFARYWLALPDEAGANVSFPVVENSRIPVRGTVFIMLAFVLVIGPVNLFVCSRLKRRTWLLWTIPAISFATCLLVFAYSLLREGVTPDARIEGLTLLDQVNRRAATLGMTAFYCPLTPSQGLLFDFDTEATPLVEASDHRFGRSTGTPRELDWSQGQHLQRGWAMARVPAHFLLRKSETRRERLQIENANGQLAVVNGLGASVRSLWLEDYSGKIYTGANIAGGQRENLSASPQNSGAGGGTKTVRALFGQVGSSPTGEVLLTNARDYLRPGTVHRRTRDESISGKWSWATRQIRADEIALGRLWDSGAAFGWQIDER